MFHRPFVIRACLALALSAALAFTFAPAPARAQAQYVVSPTPKQFFLDANGKPLAGGCVATYAGGTTTPMATYKDAGGTPNANPVVLDASGRADIWINVNAIKYVVKQKTGGATCSMSAGTVLYSVDNIQDQALKLRADLTGSNGAAIITWQPAGGVARTVASKLAETISVGDFGAVGDATDERAKIQTAINAVCATGGTLNFPRPVSYYGILAGLQFANCKNLLIQGDGGTEIRFLAGTVDTPHTAWPGFGQDSVFSIVDSANIRVEGLTLNGNLSNRTANAASESENCAVLIAGSTNVTIEKNVLKEGMTDGVLVTADAAHVPSRSVWIRDNQIANNRRNNISGVAQLGLFIKNNTISGAGTIQGTAPMAGIDIEPDYITSPVLSQDVHVEGNTVTGSAGTFAENYAGLGTAGLTVTNEHIHDNAANGINFDSSTVGYQNTSAVFSHSLVFNHPGPGVRVVGRNLDIMSANSVRNNGAGAAFFSPDGLLVSVNDFEANQNQAISTGTGALGFVNLSIQGNTFRNNFSALGQTNGASGAAFLGTPVSAASILQFDNNVIYGTQSPVTPTSPYGVSISAACQCRGGGNTAYGLNNPAATFSNVMLGAGNHNFDLTGASPPYADENTGGANFSANNGGGILRVTERQINVTEASAAPTATCGVGDIAWNGAPQSGQPIGWSCNISKVWAAMPLLP